MFVGEEGNALAVLPVAVKLVALGACRRRRLSYCNKCPRSAGGACRVIFVHAVAFILDSDAQHLITGTLLCTVMPAHLHTCTLGRLHAIVHWAASAFSARALANGRQRACGRRVHKLLSPTETWRCCSQAGPLDLPRSISRRLQPASPCPFQLQAIPS